LKTKQTYLFAKTIIACAVISAFVICAIKPLFFVSTLAHQHSDLHSKEAEKDACHRKTYHHDESHQCSHDSHIISFNSDDDITKISKEYYFNFYAHIKNHTITYLDYTIKHKQGFIIKPLKYVLSLRGPPTVA
jgi:hypothetical protein